MDQSGFEAMTDEQFVQWANSMVAKKIDQSIQLVREQWNPRIETCSCAQCRVVKNTTILFEIFNFLHVVSDKVTITQDVFISDSMDVLESIISTETEEAKKVFFSEDPEIVLFLNRMLTETKSEVVENKKFKAAFSLLFVPLAYLQHERIMLIAAQAEKEQSVIH